MVTVYSSPSPTERHMQRIGKLLQASMFLNYMWQKMRVAGAPSSMGQDEEMDTAPLAQPFFMIDKEKGMGSGDEEKRDGDDSDGGQGEDCQAKEQEEEEGDDEVSATKKASAKDGRVENGESTKTNGNHHSESEEGSEEEEGDQTAVKVMKLLPVSSMPQCQAFTS